MTPPTDSESESPQEELPVHRGDTPPQEQVRGMATPEDLEEAAAQDEEIG